MQTCFVYLEKKVKKSQKFIQEYMVSKVLNSNKEKTKQENKSARTLKKMYTVQSIWLAK